ncbi:MAG TPA: alkaline phosphatase family protein [Thermoanaerobaculia bacterium]|jgi:phospholipase C
MSDNPIEHVVVLMMENQSFDHLLGHFPKFGTLAQTPQCLPDPNGGSPICTTERKGKWSTNPCPTHAHTDVMEQVYGNSGQQPPWPEAPMNGFLTNYKNAGGDPAELMGGFAPYSLPTLSSLATHFTVCTNWFCSVPGPTGPNRLFANCASSGGYAGADFENMPPQLAPLPSVFAQLAAAGLTWQIYHQDPVFATEMVLDVVRNRPSALPADPCFLRFHRDAMAGTLANYVFLTPTLLSSQHDPWDARQGDILMNCIYSTLLDSPLWERTLLLITYDEHGGHFDHVPPPLSFTKDDGRTVGIENPDGLCWNLDDWGDDFSSPPFDFTCLGVRVPAVVVSAYTPAGVDATVYEHASISATLNELWGIGTLTRRDANANSFLKNAQPSGKRAADTLPRPPLPVISGP